VTPGAESKVSILVVDDEAVQRRIVSEILEVAGYAVESAASPDEAIATLESEGHFDVVLTDLRMPGAPDPTHAGIRLLERVKEIDEQIEVVLMTAYSDIKTAVEAMRAGAHDYLAKPFEKDELLLLVGNVAEQIRLRRENRNLKSLVAERFSFDRMLGGSVAMENVYRTIEKVQSGSSTVLIRGESGTGKELVARAIHVCGPRADRPFVAINCAAIPESLIESELFGHESGAFTGAVTAKAGRFEEVEGGTLFLDEIGSMRADLQAKLLRVIQEREFQRIGGTKTFEFHARIVAATSEDLEALIRSKDFREDLYFRLNVVPIQVPALRDRTGDIPLLTQHFIEKYSREFAKNVESIRREALDQLEAYSWPGNVRELENTIERMIVLADDDLVELDESMLPGAMQDRFASQRSVASQTSGFSPIASDGTNPEAPNLEEFLLPDEGLVLADLEKDLIRQALLRSGGKLEPTARLLGITYKTLQYRIRKYELQDFQRSS